MAGNGKIRKLYVEISGDTSKLDEALIRANAMVDRTEKRWRGQFGALSRYTNEVANGLLAIGAAGAVATGYLVKTAASFEQTSMAMKTLLGSKEAATAFMNDLRNFEPKTPFNFEDLSKCSSGSVPLPAGRWKTSTASPVMPG